MPHTAWTALGCCLTLALTAGEPFLDLSYEQAHQRAKDESKLLLVDATATWCPPCKKMEKDTWPTEPVRAWLAKHAVAIQIDVDEQQELARSLKIEAMPTVIAFKDGAEFDRVVGYKGPDDLLAWLETVRAGRRSGDEVRERSASLATSDDIDARYDVAKDLLRQREYEAASKHYLWLWKNTRSGPKYAGVRLSFMLSDIHRLCDAYEPAREAFTAYHDVLDAKLRSSGSIDMDDWSEWFALGREFEDDRRVLTYFDEKRGEDGRLPWPGPRGFLGEYVDQQVFDVLVQHGRFADAGRMLGDLEAGARKKVGESRTLRMFSKGMDSSDSLSDMARERLQDDLSRFHGAALASGQPDAAASIARMLLEEYDDAASRVALVKMAVAVGRAGPEHVAWLDEAERSGADVADLRTQLESAGAAPR
jgi:thioredoxin 1